MTTDPRPTVTPQLVIGLFITILGALLTLDALNIIETSVFRPFWPSVLIALGLAMLLKRQDSSGRFWGWIWTGLGSWLLLNALGVLRLRVWELIGPVLLIVIGWSIVRHTWHQEPPPASAPPPDGISPFPGVPGVPPMPPPAGRGDREIPGGLRSHEGGRVTLFALMGEAKRASNDHPFRGGEMTAVMGGCVLDLRQAIIAPGDEARINLVGVMAGHEIWVPPSWSVLSDVVPVLGGVDDKRLRPLEPASEHPPRLRLKGVILMGGVVIK
jgi:hypothetical protein